MNKANIFLIIILIICLVVLGYTLYNKKKRNMLNELRIITDEKIISNTFNFTKTIYDLVKRNNLTLPTESNTIIITWKMYLDNIGGEFYWANNYNKDKPIIKIGTSPHIYYNVKENKLKIITKFENNPFENNYPIIELTDINLQQWNTYSIVINTYKIKIYVNGNLKISKKLNNPIQIDDYKTKEVKIGEVNNNIFGKVRDLSIILNNLTNDKLALLNL
jgi:hypothetical protein